MSLCNQKNRANVSMDVVVVFYSILLSDGCCVCASSSITVCVRFVQKKFHLVRSSISSFKLIVSSFSCCSHILFVPLISEAAYSFASFLLFICFYTQTVNTSGSQIMNISYASRIRDGCCVFFNSQFSFHRKNKTSAK